MKDLTGLKSGKLTVTSFAERRGKHYLWNCSCECGNKTITRVDAIRSGRAKSCRKCLSSRGLDRHPLYFVWNQMKYRCTNPSYKQWKDYGGRGITYCKEWEEFIPFYEWCMANGYAKGLTLDRTNNDLGYSPSNCRFITQAEQLKNRRPPIKK